MPQQASHELSFERFKRQSLRTVYLVSDFPSPRALIRSNPFVFVGVLEKI